MIIVEAAQEVLAKLHRKCIQTLGREAILG